MSVIESFRASVCRGRYTTLEKPIDQLFRKGYAEIFKKNLGFAATKLQEGEMNVLDTKLVRSTYWIADSKSNYATDLAEVLKKSKITSVEFPADHETDEITFWKTSQAERDAIMASLPSTVKNFSIGHGEGGFTNKDLQNLTDLMNRTPGIEIHLCFSTYGHPKIGPFDDQTYEAFVKAAEKSDGVYLFHPGYKNNPLFVRDEGQFSEERETLLEQSLGTKSIKTCCGSIFDKNYAAKQQKQRFFFKQNS